MVLIDHLGDVSSVDIDPRARAEAHEMLAPVYGWFSERFGTPVLKEAKALLEGLD